MKLLHFNRNDENYLITPCPYGKTVSRRQRVRRGGRWRNVRKYDNINVCSVSCSQCPGFTGRLKGKDAILCRGDKHKFVLTEKELWDLY
jgi:hypothetical protein